MKILLTLIAFSTILHLVAPPTAQARLGETLAQCIARYGETIQADPYSAGFSRSGLIIMVYFNLDDKCDRIVFQKEESEPLSEVELDTLLTANLGDEYTLSGKNGINPTWENKDQSIATTDTFRTHLIISTPQGLARSKARQAKADRNKLDTF